MESGDALKKLLDNEGINAYQLSKMMGLSRTQPLYDILNGKVKGVSRKYANKIIEIFPKYNLGWILSGEGEPLNSSDEKENNEVTDVDKYIEELKARIEYLEVNIEMWQTTSARKEIEINKLKTENQILTDKIKILESKKAI